MGSRNEFPQTQALKTSVYGPSEDPVKDLHNLNSLLFLKEPQSQLGSFQTHIRMYGKVLLNRNKKFSKPENHPESWLKCRPNSGTTSLLYR